MPKHVMMGFALETRLGVCDLLIDGGAFDQARAYLTAHGVQDDDLPSDKSLKSFTETDEYREQYQARVHAYRMKNWEVPADLYGRDFDAAAEHLAIKSLCVQTESGKTSVDQNLQIVQAMTKRKELTIRQKLANIRETESIAKGTYSKAERITRQELATDEQFEDQMARRVMLRIQEIEQEDAAYAAEEAAELEAKASQNALKLPKTPQTAQPDPETLVPETAAAPQNTLNSPETPQPPASTTPPSERELAMILGDTADRLDDFARRNPGAARTR